VEGEEDQASGTSTENRNVIRDLHRKTCSLLCANFNAIFLPPLDVTGCHRSATGSSTTRQFVT
jgi:hypothetical protein